MQNVKIEATKRTEFGKGAARRMRCDGRLPGVIYGHGKEPNHVSFDYHEAFLLVRSNANALLEVNVDDVKQLALVKDIQRNPLTRVIEHLDLLRVSSDEKVDVEIPVEVTGEPFGNAIATVESMTLMLKAPVTAIPESITVDVEGRQDGEHITVGDLQLPEGVTFDIDPEEIVVVVAEPQEVDLPTDTEEEEPAEVAVDEEEDSEE